MKMSKHLIWFAFLAIIFLGGCMDTSIPADNPPTVNVPVENLEDIIEEEITEELEVSDLSEEAEVEEIVDYDEEIENLENEVDGLLDEFNDSLKELE